VGRVFQDDLPSIGVSRLRATGVITAEMTRAVISVGDVVADVGLSLRKFRNNGSWSFFLCPHCGRRVRTLRLFEGDALCWRCCVRRGVLYRCEPAGLRQRAELRIPRLKTKLESEVSLRLKPVLWGKLERRSRLEAALARCEFILSQGRRYRDVVTEEIEPEPIARPKVKTRK
jgi:hypothetical protein